MGKRLESAASKRITILLILALCLALRLGMAYYKGDEVVADNDARMYMEVAHNLLAGKGLAMGLTYEAKPTAHVDPVYPAFLAVIFATLGDGLLDVCTVQACLDTLSCLLVFLIASRFLGPRKLPAALAALGYAIYPPFILSACTPMTETPSTLVCLAAVYLLVAALRRTAWHVALAGAAMGLLILIRSAMLGFPLVVAVVMFVRRGTIRSWVWKSALYVAMAYLVVAPWTIRNWIVLHGFVPVNTRAGIPFWGGTGPADGVVIGDVAYPINTKERRNSEHPKVPVVSEATYQRIMALRQRLAAMNEVERDRALRRAAFAEIRQRPGRWCLLGIKKFVRLWFNLWHDFPASQESLAIGALNALIIALAVLGYIKARADVFLKLVASGACAYVSAVHIITLADMRYNYHVMPLVIIFASAYVGMLFAGKSVSAESASAELPFGS